MTQSLSSATAPTYPVPPTAQEKRAVTPGDKAVFGALAGSGEVTINQPLVNLKNFAQMEARAQGGRPDYKKMAQSLSVRTLWGGWSANTAGMAGVTATQFVVDEVVKNQFSQGGKRPLKESEKLGGAVAGGAVASLFACPSEFLMMHHQDRLKAFEEAQKKLKTAEPRPTYNTTFRSLYAEFGLRGFYKGLASTAIRDGGFVAAYSYGGNYFAEKFKVRFKQFDPSQLTCTIAGGITAGVIGAVATHPFDTWKTKKQMGQKPVFWKGGFRECVTQTFKANYRSAGFVKAAKATFKAVVAEPFSGLGPRATRVVLAVTFLNISCNKMVEALQKHREK